MGNNFPAMANILAAILNVIGGMFLPLTGGTLGGNLTVNGNETVNGQFTENGNATFHGNVVINGVVFSGNQNVTGLYDSGGATFVGSVSSGPITSTSESTGALTCSTATCSSGSVGAMSCNIFGCTDGGSLSVTGPTTVGVVNGGAVTFTSTNAGALTCSSDQVNGPLTVIGTTTVGVVNGGAATFTSILDTGNANVFTLNIGGDGTIKGNPNDTNYLVLPAGMVIATGGQTTESDVPGQNVYIGMIDPNVRNNALAYGTFVGMGAGWNPGNPLPAYGVLSTCLGTFCQAAGGNAGTAVGTYSLVVDDYGASLGNYAGRVGQYSVGIGFQAQAGNTLGATKYNYDISIGYQAKSGFSGVQDIAIGYQAQNNNFVNSSAIGTNASNTAINQFIFSPTQNVVVPLSFTDQGPATVQGVSTFVGNANFYNSVVVNQNATTNFLIANNSTVSGNAYMGGFSASMPTFNANFTTNPNQYFILVDTSRGPVLANLETCGATDTGHLVRFKKITSDSNYVQILPAGVQTIDSVAGSKLLTIPNQTLSIECNANNWFSQGGPTNPIQNGYTALNTNQTTTSTTYTTLTGMSTSITTTGQTYLHTHAYLTASNNTAGPTVIAMRMLLDGTTQLCQAGASSDGGVGSTAQLPNQMSCVAKTAILSAGSHTLAMQWLTNTGTARVLGQTGTNGEAAGFDFEETTN